MITEEEKIFDVNNEEFLKDFRTYIQSYKKALTNYEVDLSENSNKVEIFVTYILDELDLFGLGAVWGRSKNGIDVYSRKKDPEKHRRIAYEVKSSNIHDGNSNKKLVFSSMYDLDTIRKAREKNDYVIYYMHRNDYPVDMWICERDAIFDKVVEKYKNKRGQRSQNLNVSFSEFKEAGALQLKIPESCISNVFHFRQII